jgi:capsular polysaccharide biosynthesis protein
MQLREYIEIFLKRIWIFIIAIVVLTLGAYIFTVSQPDKYTGSLTIYSIINSDPKNNLQQSYYEFDNYYSFQAGGYLADTIISWLKDPVNVSWIYNDAGKDIPADNLKNYSKLIKGTKTEPATVQVTISSEDSDYVNKLIGSTEKFIINKSNEWKEKGILGNNQFDMSEAFVIKEKPPVLINTLVAFAFPIQNRNISVLPAKTDEPKAISLSDILPFPATITLLSHAKASIQPPAIVWPFSAATTGFGYKNR